MGSPPATISHLNVMHLLIHLLIPSAALLPRVRAKPREMPSGGAPVFLQLATESLNGQIRPRSWNCRTLVQFISTISCYKFIIVSTVAICQPFPLMLWARSCSALHTIPRQPDQLHVEFNTRGFTQSWQEWGCFSSGAEHRETGF